MWRVTPCRAAEATSKPMVGNLLIAALTVLMRYQRVGSFRTRVCSRTLPSAENVLFSIGAKAMQLVHIKTMGNALSRYRAEPTSAEMCCCGRNNATLVIDIFED